MGLLGKIFGGSKAGKEEEAAQAREREKEQAIEQQKEQAIEWARTILDEKFVKDASEAMIQRLESEVPGLPGNPTSIARGYHIREDGIRFCYFDGRRPDINDYAVKYRDYGIAEIGQRYKRYGIAWAVGETLPGLIKRSSLITSCEVVLPELGGLGEPPLKITFRCKPHLREL